MTLAQLETIRSSIQTQLEVHLRSAPAPGQDVMKHCNAIELLAALKTVDQIIVQEKASLVQPRGATGPVLVGV